MEYFPGDDFVEVEIVDVVRIATRAGGVQIPVPAWYLILGEKNGNKRLPIVIGYAEGESILIALSPHHKISRPLSHDLMISMITELGGKINYVAVVDIKENTFYGEIHVVNTETGKEHVLDARPSDAIAIAARIKCPIYVKNEIMDSVGVSEEQLREGAESETPQKERESPKPQPRKITKLEDMSIEDLQEQLKRAIEDENYELAAKLRDIINKKKGGSSGEK